ncbi:hypothetical protein KA005_22105 [bacterium]|nr:hypothetical protein [bacterium]
MEFLEKRFGTIAVEKGFVTIEHVAEAMKIQIIEDMGTQSHRPIGRILFEQGFITQSQANEGLDAMGITSEDFD